MIKILSKHTGRGLHINRLIPDNVPAKFTDVSIHEWASAKVRSLFNQKGSK